MQRLEKLAAVNLQQRKRISSLWEEEVIVWLDQKFDVVIVGAGFMGLWAAYFVQKKNPGLSIAVLERDRFALGASTRNAGFLTCSNISEIFSDAKSMGQKTVFELTRNRLAGVRILKNEFPELIESKCGSFDYDEVTNQKAQFMQRLNAYLVKEGFGSIFEIREARLGSTPLQKHFFNKQDSSVHPVRLLKHLRSHLLKNPNFTIINEQVRSCSQGVLNTSQNQYHYKQGLLCINSYKNKLVPSGVKIVPGRGQIIVTSAINNPETAMGYLNEGYDYWRWLKGGRLLLGGGRHLFEKDEQTHSLQIGSDQVKKYLRELAAKIVGHEDFTVERHWSGVMGFIDSGHCGTHVEKIDGVTFNLFGCGGMGVALTPFLASQVAQSLF